MENYVVYKHTSPSNKVYIGLTKQTPQKRWGNGSNYSNNKYFTNAIKKYGWKNFKHEILYENISVERAKELEQQLISHYRSSESEFGYNISLGGESGFGYKHTDEAKKRISESEKGRTSPMKGRHHSDETKKKISLANKGKTRRFGFVMSEETKKKISESQKGKPKPKPTTTEYKEKMRNAILGTKFSDKHKINHHDAILKYQRERLDTVIIQTDLNGSIIHRWQSQSEASKQLNMPQTTISLHIKNGKPYKNNYFIKLKDYKEC